MLDYSSNKDHSYWCHEEIPLLFQIAFQRVGGGAQNSSTAASRDNNNLLLHVV
jgi:hypothetical protein